MIIAELTYNRVTLVEGLRLDCGVIMKLALTKYCSKQTLID